MTIRELYKWAKEKGCLDKTLAKNCNLEIFDIETAIDISDDNEIYTICALGVDKVILD